MNCSFGRGDVLNVAVDHPGNKWLEEEEAFVLNEKKVYCIFFITIMILGSYFLVYTNLVLEKTVPSLLPTVIQAT